MLCFIYFWIALDYSRVVNLAKINVSSASLFPLKARHSGQTRHHYDALLFQTAVSVTSWVSSFHHIPAISVRQTRQCGWSRPVLAFPRRPGKQAREHKGAAAVCRVKTDVVFHPHCEEGGNYPTCSLRTGDETTIHKKGQLLGETVIWVI